ncbi:MAG: hypothetical protein N2441_10810 [Rhodocyclaceae bacterium]|nr:hypothetical protein [Rhodocyclaceae bacterium]
MRTPGEAAARERVKLARKASGQGAPGVDEAKRPRVRPFSWAAGGRLCRGRDTPARLA